VDGALGERVVRREAERVTDWLWSVLGVLSTLFGAADADAECLVLGALDARRAAAFESARPELLEEVYAEPSLAERDRALLADYLSRGLRLHGGGMQRLSCRVVERTQDRLVLTVVDRLGPTVVAGPGVHRQLPRDGADRREVTLTRAGSGWRVAAVRQRSATASAMAEPRSG